MGYRATAARVSTVDRCRIIASRLGHALEPGARMLDLGCGEGRTVYAFRDAGYEAYGFEIKDRVRLRSDMDRGFFAIGFDRDNRLPFADSEFDFVMSEQVFEHVQDQGALLRELHRVMKPGALSLHAFPARYSVIEPHIFVPFGSVFMHRWYYHFWALCGVRNQFQRGMSAKEVAHRNSCYAVEGLNYVPNSLYSAVCAEIGFALEWYEQANLDTHHWYPIRLLGKLNRVLPMFGWVNRTFHRRHLALTKVATSSTP